MTVGSTDEKKLNRIILIKNISIFMFGRRQREKQDARYRMFEGEYIMQQRNDDE